MRCGSCKSRLSALGVAMAFGIMMGLWMCLFAWSAMQWGHGTAIITQWADVYPGYDATVIGGLIGGAWGFLKGFIFGLFLAWIYNLCLCCCRCCCCKGNCKKDVVEVETIKTDRTVY